jgi:hypothetical protein
MSTITDVTDARKQGVVFTLDDGSDIEVKPLLSPSSPGRYESPSHSIRITPQLAVGIRNQPIDIDITNKATGKTQSLKIPHYLEEKLFQIIKRAPHMEAYKGTVSVLAGPRSDSQSMSDIAKSQVEGKGAKERAGVPPDVLRLTSSFLAQKPQKRRTAPPTASSSSVDDDIYSGGRKRRKTNRLPSKSLRRRQSRRLRKSRGGVRTL